MKGPRKTIAVSAIALVALGVRTYVARVDVVSTPPPLLPHLDHNPRHGGLVLMNGDTHFEVVFERTGRASVYFSDAIRTPMDPSTASDVRLTVTEAGYSPEPVVMQIDPARTSWTGRHAPVDDPDAVVRISYTTGSEQKPYWIDVPVSAWTLKR